MNYFRCPDVVFFQKLNTHPTLVLSLEIERTAKQGSQTLNPNFSLEKQRE